MSNKTDGQFTQSRDWEAFFKENFVNGPFNKTLIELKSVLLAWSDTIEVVEARQLSEGTGTLVVRFAVQPQYLNPGRTLQGGIQTAMYDVISSWVFAYARGWRSFGTSRTLTTAYIRPALEGEVLLMECELVHAGKRMGLSKGILRREKDGAIISTCEHHKYNVDADRVKI